MPERNNTEHSSEWDAFVFPRLRFSGDTPGDPVFWTCVRTRPRWEKKFTAVLLAKKQPFFFPVFRKVSRSDRHTRILHIPLFPGYVFVEGDRTKRDLGLNSSVVRLLKPSSVQETGLLHHELWSVWRGMVSGAFLTPVDRLAAGEWCEIIEGPLRGVRGRFEQHGRQGRVVLQVDMLGMGVAVELPSGSIEVAS